MKKGRILATLTNKSLFLLVVGLFILISEQCASFSINIMEMIWKRSSNGRTLSVALPRLCAQLPVKPEMQVQILPFQFGSHETKKKRRERESSINLG